MQKAAREAQVHTSWIRVNEEYEAALDRFVREVLTGESAAGFRCSLRSMVRRVMPVSVCHSISQLVLKCLMPGVPDIYQGSESWGLSLTDPDNRRPVDFANRLQVLMSFRDEDVVSRLGATSLQHALAGDVKPYVTTRLLRFRRDHRALMARARYMPIRARGERASAVVSFRRTFGREHVIVAVPRLVSRSKQMEGWPTGGFWEDTYLRVPAHVRVWSDVLSVKPVTLERMARAPLAELTTVWPWLVLYGRE
jgi:(1->4)-alpha-D-glucan 1-alpha-D-glucosylmutase